MLRYFISGLLLLTLTTAKGQRFEVGVMAGGFNYWGDLAPQVAWSETNIGGGIFTRHNFSPFFSLRNSLSYGNVSASDANFSFNQSRNLSFRSGLLELSSVIEFNYHPFGNAVLSKDITTFLYAGLGLFFFNPKGYYRNEWRELQPLGTEGQFINGNKSYSQSNISIPFGLGVKFNINKQFVLTVETGVRRTYTDYLDDVSTTYPDLAVMQEQQGELSVALSDRSAEISNDLLPLSNEGDMRGNPDFNDWYMITGVTLSFRIAPPKPCVRF